MACRQFRGSLSELFSYTTKGKQFISSQGILLNVGDLFCKHLAHSTHILLVKVQTSFPQVLRSFSLGATLNESISFLASGQSLVTYNLSVWSILISEYMFRMTSPSSVYTQLIIYHKLTNSFQYRLAVQGAKVVTFETIRNAAMLEQCCNHPKQCCNNVATPCFANLESSLRIVSCNMAFTRNCSILKRQFRELDSFKSEIYVLSRDLESKFTV